MPSTFLRRAVAILCALAGLLGAVPAARAATAPTAFKPFAPDSIWNLPLRADAALDDQSAAYSTWLSDQVTAHGSYINTATCGMPIYWADPGTPTVSVKLASGVYQDPAMLRAWAAVPIPASATPANCQDRNFAVIQPQADGKLRQWEFWAASKQADGSWIARWGGAVNDLQTDSGIGSDFAWSDPTAPTQWASVSRAGWNVTASSVSMIAGVITRRDAEQGLIDHALSVALPDAAKANWMWPAQRTDGGSTDPAAVPEGAHLRLDPNLNLAAIPMVPLVRMVAVAAQKYGIVVRDKTYNNAAFYTEEVRSGESNPFAPLLGGKWPDQALKAFPWASLRVLRASRCSVYASCSTTQTAPVNLMPGSAGTKVGVPLTLDTSNAALNQPRTRVEWDLDGDGSYETDNGMAVKVTYTPTASGTRTLRVRMTLRGGSVVLGARTFTFAPATAPKSDSEESAPAGAVAVAPAPQLAPKGTPPTPPAGGSARKQTVIPKPKAHKRKKARAASKHKASRRHMPARKHRRRARRRY